MLIVPNGRRTIERVFSSEQDAEQRFEEVFGRHFILRKQVQMKHLDGTRLRIDYLGRPKDPAQMPWLSYAGFELKATTEAIGELCSALKQAIDYRHAVITDKRFPRLHQRTPPFVFVYPDAGQEDFGGAKTVYGGAIRVAGQYNVGLARHEIYYGSSRVALHISGTLLWCSAQGSRGVAKNFGIGRRRGSR